MDNATRHILQHGYLAIFLVAFFERLGLPLLVTPFLMTAGALAGAGRINLALVVLAATVPAVAVDSAWYWLGRRRGIFILHLVCPLSLERGSCGPQADAFSSPPPGGSVGFSEILPAVWS